jgi:hypothetical protein
MHDMIGSAGMLRGWIAIWTTRALWLFVSLTVSVGAAAVAEVLIAARKRRRVMRNSTTLDHGEGIAGGVFAASAARGAGD